jgi:hypothetical protein
MSDYIKCPWSLLFKNAILITSKAFFKKKRKRELRHTIKSVTKEDSKRSNDQRKQSEHNLQIENSKSLPINK